MGWFDGSSVISSSSRSHHKKSSGSSSSKHHRSHSHSSTTRAPSIFGLGEEKRHHSSSNPRGSSIFGDITGNGNGNGKHSSSSRGAGSIFGGGDHRHNSSRSSFFGLGGSKSSSSSYYKRSPRPNFVQKIYTQLRRLLRDLIHYMKRNPLKVFILVVMPLITGGALSGLLGKFGIRLPKSVEKMFGMYAGKNMGGGGGVEIERRREVGGFDIGGAMGGIGGAVSLAKMFM